MLVVALDLGHTLQSWDLGSQDPRVSLKLAHGQQSPAFSKRWWVCSTNTEESLRSVEEKRIERRYVTTSGGSYSHGDQRTACPATRADGQRSEIYISKSAAEITNILLMLLQRAGQD